MINLKNLALHEPIKFTSAARRQVEWSKISNNDLKFLYDQLALHHSPREAEAMNEIERRIVQGTWLDLDSSPPLLENIPAWLKKWPFCLFWKQWVK